ncbi:MAG: hypothetical protein ABR602_02495, partial [Gemmatimonadales bacterium]
LDPLALAGFGLAAAFAVAQGWSLPAFCWSTWLAGLLYAWSCVVSGAVQIIATAPFHRATYTRRFPSLGKLSTPLLSLGVVAVAVPVAIAALYLYAFVFGLYGLLLSFFAEMEPHALFGRNGFINSDFTESVSYLARSYWPMAAGALLANATLLYHTEPWQRMLNPASTEIVRIHVLVVVMPIIALVGWALFGDSYHTITIVLLMGVFYLLPRGTEKAFAIGSVAGGQSRSEG